MRNLKISAGHIRRSFVATVLCLLAVLSGNAYASYTPTTYLYYRSADPTNVFTSGEALCAALTVSGLTWFYSAPDQACKNTTNINQALVGKKLVCDDHSAPVSGQCADSTKPVNNCPTAGSSAGITNVTTAWANGPDITSKVQTKIVPDGGLGAVGSVNYCVSSCGITNSGAAPTGCWQSSVPSSTGLYRISCDVPMQNTGQPCTVGSGGGSSLPDPTVAPPAPACAGSSGTVNGKTVCLDAPTSTPNATVPYPKPGNPAPGTTGGGDKSTGVDPGTGAGTGTNGTGTGAAGGTSGGGGGSVTVNVPETPTCGLPGKPKCQMDETGTPANGDSVFATAKEALDTAVTAHTNAMTQVTGDDNKDTSWGWFPSFPQGTCTPIQFGALGEIDWCSVAPSIQLVMSFLWSLVTVIFILYMTSGAIKGK